MEKVTGLVDINPSDTVFTDGINFVKVRVLEVEIDPKSDPAAARNFMVLEVSASVCSATGKALPDLSLGYLIAPASRHSCQLQGMVEKSIKSQDTEFPKTPGELVDEWVNSLMEKHAKEALLWLTSHQVRTRFVKYQPTSETTTTSLTEAGSQNT